MDYPGQIVFTTLPNFSSGGELQLSIVVSPFLQPKLYDRDAKVGDFDYFVDWPATVRKLSSWRLMFRSMDGQTHEMFRLSDVDVQFPPPEASRYWSLLFPTEMSVLPVQPQRKIDGTYSYPAHELEAILCDIFKKTARLFPSEYPTAERLRDEVFSTLSSRDRRNFESMIGFFRGLQEPRADAIPDRSDKMDFHMMVSSLGSFPFLQRLFGLVVDVRVPYSFTIPTEGTVFVDGLLPRTDPPYKMLMPVTRYSVHRNNPEHFQAVPGDFMKGRIVDGMVLLDHKHFRSSVINVESGGKVMQLDELISGSDGVLTRCSLPTLSSEGVALLSVDGTEMLAESVRRNQELTQWADDLPADGGDDRPGTGIQIHADDVMEGFRVDIYDELAGSWKSLCDRNGVYQIRGDGEPLQCTDQGAVTTAVSLPLNDEWIAFYLSPAVCRWDGWSLAVKRPGKAQGERGFEPNEGTPAETGLQVALSPVAGSLPLLRFGREYRLRLRMVDIAGNSISMDLADRLIEDQAISQIVYHRFDPVAYPEMVLRKPLRDDCSDALDVLVIRSNHDTTATAYATTHGYEATERHLAPPRVSQRMAEAHGMFDRDGQLSGTPQIHAMITEHEGEFEDLVDRDQVEVPYLPDPLAARISAALVPDSPVWISYDDSESWPKIRTVRLSLQEGASSLQEEEGGLLCARLEQAETRTLRVSSAFDPASTEMLDLLGVLNWAQHDLSVAEAVAGKYWMLTPYREVQLVHAVQQPLAEPLLILSPLASNPDETDVGLDGTVSVDAKSTVTVDIQAQWQEWRDEKGHGPPRQVSMDAHLKQRLVDVHEDTVAIGQQGDVLRHEFGNTRSRLVHYHAIATTRFQEYFPQNQDLVFTREGPHVHPHSTVRRLSTARPARPEVDYSVPAFQWTSKLEQEQLHKNRKGNWLRVYLHRPWYSSGDGEALGVVVPRGHRPDGSVDPDLAPYASIWGKDPIWQGQNESLPPLDVNAFEGAQIVRGVRLRELDQTDARMVDVASYGVVYDEDLDLWYADISLTNAAAYTPFVRLCVGRFQPHSIRDASRSLDFRLSEVVQIGFLQVLNDRQVSFGSRRIDATTVQVDIAVSGIGLKNVSVAMQQRRVGGNDFDWGQSQPAVELTGNRDGAKVGQLQVRHNDDLEMRLVVKEAEAHKKVTGEDVQRVAYIETATLAELLGLGTAD